MAINGYDLLLFFSDLSMHNAFSISYIQQCSVLSPTCPRSETNAVVRRNEVRKPSFFCEHRRY